ncbi:MAG: sigma-54-dependent Fis family transcriptional regulator [Deltaproteobacteria bacterium]|nr:sigma-54-dependent Fis family transcriptional regulator [Deltaproteobacteria bacterium]
MDGPVSRSPDRRFKVLVVDDEPYMLQAWQKMLEHQSCEIRTLPDGSRVLDSVAGWRPDVVLLDMRLPGKSGVELLQEIKDADLECEIVMMTAYASVETAVEAVKLGAYDYLTKPFVDIDAATLTVLKAARHKRLVERNRELESLLDVQGSFEGFVGQSAQMRKVFELIEGVAYSASTVLIQGESGTGKELVARAVHHRSPRRSCPFVAINCTALTDTLLESELFGHEKGAFTGATCTKRGLFEVCDGGSIFLDEIGGVPAATQVKLLRVLQEGEMKRVGSNEIRRVDVRVIAATNMDLAKAKREGTFREDLFYRLNVITIELPPLRERAGDVPLLALHFMRKHNQRTGKSLVGIQPQTMALLEGHSWPGNVRELENVIERAVVLGRGPEIAMADLPESLRRVRTVASRSELSFADLPFREARQMAMGDFEQRYLVEVLGRSDGNVSQAARLAGMDRSNFKRVMKKHGVQPDQFANRGSGQGSPAHEDTREHRGDAR